jgi:hypothetical protein
MEEQPRRSVVKVIEELLTVIPEEEEDLSTKLIEYKASLWNQAPERLTDSDVWVPVQNILATYILDIETPWKEYTLKIFNNTLDE